MTPNGCSVDHDRQEDDGQRGQQDVQRDLVRRLLPLGALDQGDHPVEERLARSAVIRTTMRSDSTLVPPVTAERSPPDSRITGADSPVIADSSTDAMPFDDLAVGRDQVAGLAHHDVALAQLGRGDELLGCRRADSACLGVGALLRSVSACALPRPSATASAKLANSTVNQSQTVIGPVEDAGVRDRLDEGHDRADQHDEHHRVPHLNPRIQLAERVHERRARGSRGRTGCGRGAGRRREATAGAVRRRLWLPSEELAV